MNLPSFKNNLLAGLPIQWIAGISLFTAVNAFAVDIVATVDNSEFPDDPAPVVSNTDLLQTAFGSVNASSMLEQRGTTIDASLVGETTLRNGVWDLQVSSRSLAVIQDDEFAEYSLDLEASPGGYTISGVELFSNWGSGQGRDRIQVNVSFSLVGTPDVFDQVLVDSEANPLFVYNPPTQTQGKMALSGFSVEGVAAIRFLWPATQENGAVGYSEIDVFGTSTGNDSTPPTLTITDPVSGAASVVTTANLVFTFDEDVQAGTGTVELRNVSSGELVEDFDVTTSGQVDFNGRNFTIDPTDSLLPGVEYFVTIPSGAIQDLSSNPFAGIPASPDPEAFTFTTDATPPVLGTAEPLLNGLPTADLTLQFDEAVQVGSGQITIHAANGDILQTFDVPSGDVTVNGDTVIVNVSDLLFGTDYYINYTAGAITDLSGNAAPAVSDNSTIAFTTVATTLIHYWPFEGDVIDSAGTHDGTLLAATGFDAGQVGQALSINATNQGVTMGRASLPETNFTLACWVNPTLLTGTRIIAGTRFSDERGAYLNIEGGGIPHVHLQSETNIVIEAPEPLVVGEWTHLAFTVDQTSGVVLYVNGQPVAMDAAGTGHAVMDNFTVGRNPDTLGPTFEGLTDELSIYAEVLSQSAIADLAGNIGPLVLNISQNGGNLDFEWNSMNGTRYDLVTSTDLATSVENWVVYDDGVNPPYEDIVSQGLGTTLTGVAKVGPVRFFSVIERVVPALLFEDFENGIPDEWVAIDNGSGTVWEAGDPSTGPVSGPPAAFGGLNSAGTNITANYTPVTDISLTTPAVAIPAEGATLSFQQFIDSEVAFDFGRIRILDADNGDSEISGGDFPVIPIEGTSTDWELQSFPLPAGALGGNIRIRFEFISDISFQQAGFYIDDVQISPDAP